MNDTGPSTVDTDRLGSIAVLVIDHHRKSANLVRAILEPFGVSVVSVRSAEEAELMLAAITPDVLICDIVLPGEDGVAFLRRLRGRAGNAARNIPAIATTAAYEEADVHAVRRAGYDVILKKPVDSEQLPQLITRLLATARPAPSVRQAAE
jgi:CheY-like chemotaxis protein